MRGRRLVTTERIVAIASSTGSALADDLEAWCEEHELEVVTLEVGTAVSDDHVISGRTVGVSIGGDGTYLEAIKQFAPREIPVLGIDAGTSPFLVRIDPADMTTALEEVLQGRATIESRSQLRVRAAGFEGTGLNEVTLEHVPPNRPVERKISNFRVFVDNEYAGTYAGDGVMFSTPTGSTGLALSAGGPIHYPRNNRTVQITPLLVHDLSARSVVVDDGVPLAAEADRPATLSVDGGRHHRRLEAGEVVRIEVARKPAEIIHPEVETSFFEALADRLGWHLRSEDPTVPKRRDDPAQARGIAIGRWQSRRRPRSASGVHFVSSMAGPNRSSTRPTSTTWSPRPTTRPSGSSPRSSSTSSPTTTSTPRRPSIETSAARTPG